MLIFCYHFLFLLFVYLKLAVSSLLELAFFFFVIGVKRSTRTRSFQAVRVRVRSIARDLDSCPFVPKGLRPKDSEFSWRENHSKGCRAAALEYQYVQVHCNSIYVSLKNLGVDQ